MDVDVSGPYKRVDTMNEIEPPEPQRNGEIGDARAYPLRESK